MSPELKNLKTETEELKEDALEADENGDLLKAEKKYQELHEKATTLVEDFGMADWDVEARMAKRRLNDIQTVKQNQLQGNGGPSPPPENNRSKKEYNKKAEEDGDTGDERPADISSEYDIINPSIDVDDVVGHAGPKRVLENRVKKVFEGSELVEKLALNSVTGIIMYGPPGTGKTMLSKAFASEVGDDTLFIRVKASQIVSKWVGEPQKNVTELFETARTSAPVIVFIDEIDQLLESRDSDDAPKGHDKMVGQLLEEMSDIDDDEDIAIIGATNRITTLDDAATRPGRFTKSVYVGLPDRQGRKEMLTDFLADVETEGVDQQCITQLARKTTGYSGSDVEQVVREAKWHAFDNERGFVTVDDLEVGIKQHSISYDLEKWAPYERGEAQLDL